MGVSVFFSFQLLHKYFCLFENDARILGMRFLASDVNNREIGDKRSGALIQLYNNSLTFSSELVEKSHFTHRVCTRSSHHSTSYICMRYELFISELFLTNRQ